MKDKTERMPVRARSKSHSAIRLVAWTALFWLTLNPAWGQDQVQTRAWPHPGFARIVFDWPAAVTYEARVEGNTLFIDFDRSLTSDLGRVVRFLPEYVTEVSLSEDGKSVSAALKGSFGLRTSTSNNSIVVDLLQAEPAPTASARADITPPADITPQAESTAQAAEPAKPENVRVRFGEHANFTRVVFDWTRNVDYKVEKSGETVGIRFDHDAQFDLTRLASGEFPLVNTASSGSENGRAVVELQVAEATRFRHFRDGTKVVIDILRGAGRQAAPVPVAPQPREALPEAQPRADLPAPPPPAEKRVETEVPADPAAPRPVASSAGDEDEEYVPEVPAVPQQPVEVARVPALPVEVPRLSEPTNLSPSDAAVDSEDHGPESTSLSGIRVSVAAGPAGPVLAFEWQEPAAAAVFQRAGYFWVVFDRAERSVLLPIPPDVADSVFLAEAVPNDMGSAFRFKVKPGLQAVVSRDGAVWRIDFASNNAGPAEPIPVRRESAAANGPRIFLPVTQIGRRVDINDPEVGDVVHVVPVLTAGQGVPVERAFVEFDLLPTAQGVVVSPRADDVTVRPLRNGVEISGPDGLIMSSLPEVEEHDDAGHAVPAPEATAKPEKPRQRSGGLRDLGPSLFKYLEWRGGPDGGFNDTRKHLNLLLAKAPKGAQNAALWDLAKFYFAFGMAADAIGLTDIILENNPSASEDHAFNAVRGASFYLMGRLPQAEQNLLDPSLGLDTGAALWRGAVLAAREEWAAARQEFEIANLQDEQVPPVFRTHFQLLAARAAMLAGDGEEVEFVLKGVTEETARPDQMSEAELIRAQLLLGQGKNEEALEAFKDVSRARVRPTRPWAHFTYTNARLELEEISREEAIDELEALRHAWRGGGFEFRLLNRLSELYLESNQYRNGLLTMRETVGNFSERPESKEITAQMNKLFRDLFLDHGADEIPPVNALALYFDFRELTPVGSDGDAMIRLLADRLVEVDLLGRAAQLIQHQVTFRLKGEEKSRIGTKLAAIYILDRQYEQAMEALRESRWRALSKEVLNERKYLLGQARIGLKQYDEAISLLRDDESVVAETLRADIYWKTSDWNRAADAFAAVLRKRWENPDPLSLTEQQQVMQMTVALALSDQRERTAAVRERYSPLMAGTPDSAAFEIVTGDFDRSATSFRAVAGKVAQIGTLESFMARYRDSLDEEGVGTLN